MNADNIGKPDPPQKKAALLLGIGFDHSEGECRVSRGRDFVLTGGSKDTHEAMQEKAIKFNEELDRRKKRLSDIDHKEFRDIAERVRLGE